MNETKTWTISFTPDQISKETMKEVTGLTDIDAEAELEKVREELEKVREELEVERQKVQKRDEIIKGYDRLCANKDGMIDGLKFALRCNGVSGGEV